MHVEVIVSVPAFADSVRYCLILHRHPQCMRNRVYIHLVTKGAWDQKRNGKKEGERGLKKNKTLLEATELVTVGAGPSHQLKVLPIICLSDPRGAW